MSNARKLADNLPTDGQLGNRNLIINGAMQVAQRGTSFTGISSGDYNLDRFKINAANSTGSFGTWTASQDSDAPDGFASSLKMDCTATSTIVSLTFLRVEQRIEGQNLQQLKKGLASAEPLTLSFWVKSAKTGVHTAELFDSDNNRNFSQQYTVNSAGTWEYKTITYTGDTTGSLDNDNNVSFYVAFWLLAGSSYDTGTQSTEWAAASNRATGQVDLGDSTSNYWQITGVQLEAGSEATPFEHRTFADEFQACQRYFARSYAYGTATGASTSLGMRQTDYIENNQGAGYRERYDFKFPVQLRASPTITTYDTAGNSGKGNYYIGASSGNTNKTINVGSVNATSFGGYSDRATTIGGWAIHYTADAEL